MPTVTQNDTWIVDRATPQRESGDAANLLVLNLKRGNDALENLRVSLERNEARVLPDLRPVPAV